MKTIELTDEQYKMLLSFKNLITLKIGQVTNPEVRHLREVEKEMPEGINEELDYDPTYSFGKCIEDTICLVVDEQETGEVNFIT